MNFKTLQNGFVKKAVSNSKDGQATSTNSSSSTTYFASARLKNEKLRNYFDDDDDEVTGSTEPSDVLPDSDDFDPLDAFMAGVQEEVQSAENLIGSSVPRPEIVSGQDNSDYEVHLSDTDEPCVAEGEDVSYDSDGCPILDPKKASEKSRIEPLQATDHATISYKPFRRNFYKATAESISMTETDVANLRDELEVSVNGSDTPRPVKTFAASCLPPNLLKEISKVGFERPTSIQAQALPIALSGRDLIGLAKTGSGKTLAYVWPMLVHILDQPQMQIGDGPIGIILSPTRELASQIFTEAKKFAKVFSIRVCAVYGGGGKWEMVKALKEAPEIVVATPGRFIELIRSKATNLHRCTMVVLDEADRMFELATMKRKVEGFARELLNNPIRIVVGTIGQANPDIRQVVEIVDNEAAKWTWLSERADEYVAEGKVLIFVLSKVGVEEIAASLRRHFMARQLDVGVESLHGDKDQSERTNSMRRFSKSADTAILVATDIASRGLDVKDIRTVINYDVAKNIETYVHRIGRTGRMGLDGVVPGTAYTLLTPADSSFAVDLVQNLNLSSQKVSTALQALAEKDPKWSRIRHITAGGGRGAGVGGARTAFSSGTAGRGGGLGYAAGGQSVPKAMTSAMLASSSGGGRKGGVQMTFSKAMGASATPSQTVHPVALGGAIPGNTAANPYIEGQGMGRGKHLTKPSWSDGSEAPTNTTENASHVGLKSGSTSSSMPLPQSSAAVSMSSNSQFDDAPNISSKRSRAEEGHTAIPSGMSGFVRASSTGASFAAPPPSVQPVVMKIASLPVKKSRWDT